MNRILKKTLIPVLLLSLGLSNSLIVHASRDKDAFISSFLESIENHEAIEAEPKDNSDNNEINIKIKDAAYPEGEITLGEEVELKGTISSDARLVSIEFKITNIAETKNYDSYTVKPDAENYKIPSAVNNKIQFSNLARGNYKYIITAEDAKGDKGVIIKKTFKIIGEPSTLCSNIKLSKKTIYEGEGSYVSGTITSNYKINKVTVEIVGTEYCEVVKPYKTTYSISSAIDAAMRFDKLEKGTYTFRITASDVSGKTVTQSIKVTVKSSKFERIIYNLTGVQQRTTSDCAFTSMVNCELYNSLNGKGALGNTLANADDPYKKLKARNGNSTYGNWYLIGYEKVYSSSLETLYKALEKGPVIVHKTSAPAGHYSVVYGYEGSNTKLYAKDFLVYEVTNGVRMSLNSWLTSAKSYSYNINGPGALDAMVVKQ